MGLKVELNTMIRLKDQELDYKNIELGKSYTISRENVRMYVIEIPILFLAEDWKVLGYCKVSNIETNKDGVKVTFEPLMLFSDEESKLYTDQLLEVLKQTGYLS